MTQYVYMNERIREKKPRKAVIVVQGVDETQVANLFEIKVGDIVIGYAAFDRKGLDACVTHDVKAWVEFHDAVKLTPVAARKPAPEAKAKRPGKLVQSRLVE